MCINSVIFVLYDVLYVSSPLLVCICATYNVHYTRIDERMTTNPMRGEGELME